MCFNNGFFKTAFQICFNLFPWKCFYCSLLLVNFSVLTNSCFFIRGKIFNFNKPSYFHAGCTRYYALNFQFYCRIYSAVFWSVLKYAPISNAIRNIRARWLHRWLLQIVNEIATAMRTTTAAVETEIMRRKYGEIGGMYNIKQVYQLRDKTFYKKILLRYYLFISEHVSFYFYRKHKLHQAAAAVYHLAPRLLRNSICRSEDSSSTTIIRW